MDFSLRGVVHVRLLNGTEYHTVMAIIGKTLNV